MAGGIGKTAGGIGGGSCGDCCRDSCGDSWWDGARADRACVDGACADEACADGACIDGACTGGAYTGGACTDGAYIDKACSCPLLGFLQELYFFIARIWYSISCRVHSCSSSTSRTCSSWGAVVKVTA